MNELIQAMTELIRENPRTLFMLIIGAFCVVWGVTQHEQETTNLGIGLMTGSVLAGATLPPKNLPAKKGG